ncbi:hypothetical protein PG985_013690 [Apiospora marii]|uniref:uncharacterized protein n=1 Tax=Apiospora marii TaxID=335849 RepID=UPI00312D7ADA
MPFGRSRLPCAIINTIISRSPRPPALADQPGSQKLIDIKVRFRLLGSICAIVFRVAGQCRLEALDNRICFVDGVFEGFTEGFQGGSEQPQLIAPAPIVIHIQIVLDLESSLILESRSPLGSSLRIIKGEFRLFIPCDSGSFDDLFHSREGIHFERPQSMIGEKIAQQMEHRR